jgi:hypothetical protein
MEASVKRDIALVLIGFGFGQVGAILYFVFACPSCR